MRLRRRLLIVSSVLLGLAGSLPSLAAPYVIEDLETLAKKHSWDELLSHINDIPTAKRGPAWHDLVEQAALGKVAAVKGDDLAVFDETEALWSGPLPLEEGEFAKRRAKLLSRLKSPSSTAFKAGKVAGSHYETYGAAELFAAALASKGNDAPECADPVLADMTVRALDADPKNPVATWAHQLAVQCYSKLAAPLRAQLWTFQGDRKSNYFANVCGLLKSHGTLSGLQARECKQ
jgi:hypothetical protein